MFLVFSPHGSLGQITREKHELNAEQLEQTCVLVKKKPMGRRRDGGWACHKSVRKGYRYILAHLHAQINSTVHFFPR